MCVGHFLCLCDVITSLNFDFFSTLVNDFASGLTTEDDAQTIADPDIDCSMFVASGSASKKVFVYDVGRATVSTSVRACLFAALHLIIVAKSQGKVRLLNALEGHSDIVYAADFHPTEPLLASASADGLVKLWMPQGL